MTLSEKRDHLGLAQNGGYKAPNADGLADIEASRPSKTSQARWLDDLSPTMRKALLRIHTLTVLINDPSVAGVRTTTLNALHRHGLIEHGHDKRLRAVWTTTPRGRQIITTEPIRALANRGRADYVDPDDYRAMRNEPEPVDQAELERQAKDARTAEKRRRDHETRKSRELIAAEIQRLQAADLGDTQAKRLAALGRILRKINEDMAA